MLNFCVFGIFFLFLLSSSFFSVPVLQCAYISNLVTGIHTTIDIHVQRMRTINITFIYWLYCLQCFTVLSLKSHFHLRGNVCIGLIVQEQEIIHSHNTFTIHAHIRSSTFLLFSCSLEQYSLVLYSHIRCFFCLFVLFGLYNGLSSS